MTFRASLFSLVACCCFLPAAGYAQQFGGAGGLVHNGFQPPVKPRAPTGTQSEAPPPALPGASSGASAAPPQHLPTDLSPNDALFDAIDRGDLAAAKDAISRGAELDAVNVLGMTPLEASVDQGRNDITFLLLSLRGASPSGRAGVVGASAAGRPPELKGGKVPPHAAVIAHVSAVRPAQIADQSSNLPRVEYSVTDNNVADPKNGFLGFGPTGQP